MEYKVIRVLSQHTDSGTIVELVENTEQRQYVVKRIQHLETPIYKAIFQKETQALLRLKGCENIVRIFHPFINENKSGQSEGIIPMEYIPGHPLSQMFDRIPSITHRYQIVKQLTNAIRHAHQNSVIHRDINPNNILLTSEFELKLIDFGIAKIRGMLQAGTTYQFATQSYSAPEVAIHSENATERSDIYSLGAVIYFLFTGNVPPPADQLADAISKAGGMDAKLKAILCKMCALAPADRYENIDDCEIALSELYERYCGSEERYYFVVPIDHLDTLTKRNLVQRGFRYDALTDSHLPAQFSGGLIRKLRGRDGEPLRYCIDGINISMECVLINDVFHVTSFQRLDAYKREQHKKYSLELPGHFNFVLSYRLDNTKLIDNCDNLAANRVEDFQNDISDQRNIDAEYTSQYGIWQKFIQAMIEDASKNALRLYYKSVRYSDGVITFSLEQDPVDEEELNQETLFIFERAVTGKTKHQLLEVGTFLRFQDDGATLVVKASPRHPTLPQKGSICVDYRKEIKQYRRQEAALENFRRSETANPGNLKSIFIGFEEPGRLRLAQSPTYFNPSLDLTQRRAVRKVLEADDIALIQGPPGTGKTNVLVEVVRQILNENAQNPALNQKILIVSQSHAAVDKILEDLRPFLDGVTAIRIGSEEKIAEAINTAFGLDHCQASWAAKSVARCNERLASRLAEKGVPLHEFLEFSQALEELKVKNIDETEKIRFERVASTFESTYSLSRNTPYVREWLIMAQWTRRLTESNELGEYYIKDAAIVAGTCIGFISDPYVRDTVFDYVIVDEAAKATIPEIMVPLVRARKVILVGDHKQLPPVLDREAISRSAEEIHMSELQATGFGKLFELLSNDCKETLSTQYRMHPAIGDLVSLMFYDGKVQNGVSEVERGIELPWFDGCAITWISTSDNETSRFEQAAGHGRNGYINPLEVTLIQQLLRQLDVEMEHFKLDYTVGVITPYRAQLDLLKTRLAHTELKYLKVDINTVDAFQGSQRDIIIYSTVRSGRQKNIGFLREAPRLNVSFSRAQRALVIVGDAVFLNDTDIRGNQFPYVQQYIHAHLDSCRIIDAKEITNAQ